MTRSFYRFHSPLSREFFGIDRQSVHMSDTGLVDRDIIIEYIRKQKRIGSTTESRIVDITRLKTVRSH